MGVSYNDVFFNMTEEDIALANAALDKYQEIEKAAIERARRRRRGVG